MKASLVKINYFETRCAEKSVALPGVTCAGFSTLNWSIKRSELPTMWNVKINLCLCFLKKCKRQELAACVKLWHSHMASWTPRCRCRILKCWSPSQCSPDQDHSTETKKERERSCQGMFNMLTVLSLSPCFHYSLFRNNNYIWSTITNFSHLNCIMWSV